MHHNRRRAVIDTKLSLPLLQSVELSSSSSALNIRGSYNAMQFAVRLNPQVHHILDSIDVKMDFGRHNFGQCEAFSTLLHENIHWWQYMGSNFGVVSSLKFPSQTHVTLEDLRQVVSMKGPFKSILKYDDIAIEEDTKDDFVCINRILNNWHDLEIANQILWKPELVNEHLKDRFFVSVSHSFRILWASSVLTLASSVDPHFSFLPHPRDWVKDFSQIRTDQKKDASSKSFLISLGVKAIMEGQARLSQLQYLCWHSPSNMTLQYFEENRLLDGIYGEALQFFLKTLKKQMPESPHDPLIGLFLLVCDLSLNPCEGFPLPIVDFRGFDFSNDPSKRFYAMCLMIRDRFPHLQNAIRHYSKEEYISISTQLAEAIGDPISPYECTSYVAAASEKNVSFINLLKEESSCLFQEGNLPIRVFFSKYLRFQQDKAVYPQFFCWPGVLMGLHSKNQLSAEVIKSLFNKHHALFINREDDNIYPVLFRGVEETNIDQMFNRFYTWNSTYELIRQWIAVDGPFAYNFEWLTTKWHQEQVKEWACNNFKQLVGIHPDSFLLL